MHRADHLGQCPSRAMYANAVDLAQYSVDYVKVFAGSGVVDEMSLHHVHQALGHLTRACAVTRDALAQMASDALEHAVRPATARSWSASPSAGWFAAPSSWRAR